MLDEFVQVTYERKAEEDHVAKLAASMEQLPTSELKKIARFGLMGMDDGKGWLDKYKGTPLFDRAVELEQQSLQMEMQRVQSDQDRQLRYQAEDQARASEDQLCIQKRMLDLELASQENAAVAGQAAMAMGGAPPGAEMGGEPPMPPPEAAPPEAGPPPPEAGPEAMKMAAARMQSRMKFAEAAGRMMTRTDMSKEAIGWGRIGANIAKVYKNKGLGAAASTTYNTAGGLGRKALRWAGKNPGTAMGVAGAGGLAAGAGLMAGANRQ